MGQISDQQKGSNSYCIPVERRSSFHVLAAGDSITQGSVPSRGFNYPYAIKLEELLRKKLGPRTRAIDAGGLAAAAAAAAAAAGPVTLLVPDL
jgi:hypothetical protein